MKTRKPFALIGVVALLFSVGVTYAQQDGKVELEQKPLPPLPNSISGSETVKSRMQSFAKAQGMREGDFQEGERTILVNFGYGTIASSAAAANFVQARINAFNKAMLDAKGKCAEFQETRLKTETTLDMKAPSVERAKIDAQRMQREGLAQEGAVKVAQALNSDIKAKNAPSSIQTAGLYGQKILDNKMREELRKKGIDPDKPVAEQQVKAIIESTSFTNLIRTTARARCTGIKALASFEQNPGSGQGQVGIVTVWTEKLHQIADAIVTGEYDLIPQGDPGKPISEHVPTDLRTLLTTYGTQLVRDEKGQYSLLAYSQAQPRTKNQQSVELAFQKARTQAFGLIRSFLGEAVSVTTDMLDKEESSVFEDESIKVADEGSYAKKIAAVGEKLPISGLQEVHSWETLHPASNGLVVGVVVQWKASTAQIAGVVKAMNRTSGNKAASVSANMSAGGSTGARASAPPSAPKVASPYSGQGKVSRDF